MLENLTPSQEKVKYITRAEIASRLGLCPSSIAKFIKSGKVPGKTIRNGRHWYYDRDIVEDWMIGKQERTKIEKEKRKASDEDIYGIRTRKQPFVYSGRTLMHILFCQPALRNGTLKYEDCK